jgi:hypothetical protein
MSTSKTPSANKFEKVISHARTLSDDNNGIIVALTKDKNLVVLSTDENAKIATEVGQEWFEDSAMTLDQYKDTIVEGSNYDLVKDINTNKKYQDQLSALEKEKVMIENDMVKVEKSRNIKEIEELDVLENL